VKHNWKKILIIFIIFVAWYFVGGIGFFHIPGVGFKSGCGNIVAYKTCSCLGIPNNEFAIGGGRDYCIGIVYDCHCYVGKYDPNTGKRSNIFDGTTEVDCSCTEDVCKLFRVC